jgi:hypothetical protein
MTSRFSQGLKSLGANEARKRNGVPAPEKPATAAVPEPRSQEKPEALRYTAPSRRGKKAVTGYFDPAVRQQLAILAAEEDRSQNDLIAEALNMLFKRYRKSPIAKE